jgi:translation elongation factor EF-4
VLYKSGKIATVRNPAEFPSVEERRKVEEFQEPMVLATIVVPQEYLGEVMELCGVMESIDYMHCNYLP